MRYGLETSVEIGAWVAIDADSEINYMILPAADAIEFSIGGRNGLDLDMDQAGLRCCIAAFTAALDEFERRCHSVPSASENVATTAASSNTSTGRTT